MFVIVKCLRTKARYLSFNFECARVTKTKTLSTANFDTICYTKTMNKKLDGIIITTLILGLFVGSFIIINSVSAQVEEQIPDLSASSTTALFYEQYTDLETATISQEEKIKVLEQRLSVLETIIFGK